MLTFKRTILIAILILGVTSWRASAQQKDTIYLNTGQILIGIIKKMELGLLSFKDDDLLMLNIKVNKLKWISAGQHFFRIETANGQLYYGRIVPDTIPGRVLILSGVNTFSEEIISINKLFSFRKKFTDRLEGNISAGYSFTRSSDIGQLNVSTSVKYTTSKNQLEFSGSTIGTFDSSTYSRDREDAKILDYYYFSRTWFTALQLNYQRNLELSIARRYSEMAGLGNKFLVSTHFQALGISGISLNQEKSIEGTVSPVLVEIPFILRLNYFKFKSPNIQVGTTQSVYVSLSQKGRVRYDGNTTFYWEIIRNFSINLTFYNSFDNQPPDPNASKKDYGIVFGLTYKFNQ
ncbi:MAG: hypothetical protein C5B52_04185 [Bacteroidetes bacterium]|nr:MAG: hypothetical protein C5B52_04185 [Bacteroidota bacterium]